MPEPIDYAALAEEVRRSAPVDYTALAAQTRAEGSGAKTLSTVSPDETGNYYGGLLQGFGREMVKNVKSVGDLVKTHPATAGAMAGAMVAVPFTGGASAAALPAMAAAGLGGAGGAGLGLMAGALTGSPNLPTTAGGVAQTMATEGATQAAAEGGGRIIQGALRLIAPRWYQGLAKPSTALRADHPDAVATALAHNIPVTQGGADDASQLVAESRQAATDLVKTRAAAPNAPMIQPRAAVRGIVPAVQDARGLPVAGPQLQAIGDYGRQYLKEHPGPIDLARAHEAVRATDKFFNPAYRATMDRGNAVTSGQTAAALGINDATRGLLRDAVPGLQAQNAQTSALMGAAEMVGNRAGAQANLSPFGMQHLINAGVGSGVGAVGGKDKGIATFAALEAATNPAIGSQLAIAANRGAAYPWSQLLRAAILRRLSGGDPSAPPQ